MSPNIQESEAMGRKRSHEEFTDDVVKVEGVEDTKTSVKGKAQITIDAFLPRITEAGDQPSPQGSPDLTEAGSSTPARESPSPQTPTTNSAALSSAVTLLKPNIIACSSTQSKSTANPPAKRKRLTAAEKSARDKEQAEQKKEREEAKAAEKEAKAAERAAKAAEKAKAEEEKAARTKEKAAEKAKADEEKAAKAKERDDKKRKKEEEQKKLQDEKDKKARSQRTLGNFFKLPSTPKKLDSTSSQDDFKNDASPVKSARKASKTEYEKRFQPFFVKTHTKVAPLGPQMDDETREVKSKILDECISGQRSAQVTSVSFDAVTLFALPGKHPRRGKLHHPVRHIMEQVYKETEKSDNADPDHANKMMKEARQKLVKVPMKVIAFSQDVRPPYYGTMTFKPFALGQGNMSQLARKPTGRRLPLDYDYDSEAEWQEEEGEDLDMDDDEEELDDEDDMEEFLDDSEDAGLSRRIFANALEPESTGICFENGESVALNQTVYDHRMEFMHDGLEQSWGIDPFSTEYWEPEPKTKTAKVSKSGESTTKMPPPSAPTNAFAALAGGTPAADAPKLVKNEIMDDVKRAILNHSALSKVGMEDVVFQMFRTNASRTEVKNTLVHVAERQGKGRQKTWVLKPGHGITSS
ncbi:chromatin assembly factor 1 subunit A-domain-containing protein [Ilyonectria sp. MPI-CAGE-AT-0026]|nr:chromatin assembly factor 1 subunit A-domain-containing protein [Ilyonectria sp. MPI-CAGE-AT-0026]